jgi:two-component system response regulator YesN
MYSILLVDDEMSVVDGIEASVPWQEIGIDHVYKALSATEALQILSQYSVDIVLTDIRMPGIDGLEFIRRARQNWKNIKYILLTGFAEFDYARQAIRVNAFDYILKPVSDEKIAEKIRNAVAALQEEHNLDKALRRALRTLREHLPKLREELLMDVLLGKHIPSDRLRERLESLDLPVRVGDLFAIMLVRLETDLTDYNVSGLQLIEFAAGNIAEDVFGDMFELWHGKDSHDFLVFFVLPKHDGRLTEEDHTDLDNAFQQRAVMLQSSVRHYLKCTVSITATVWGQFPGDAAELYHQALSAFRNLVGGQREWFCRAPDQAVGRKVHVLRSLYEPPLLLHLMETANWLEIRRRMGRILDELKDKWVQSGELAVEVFLHFYTAFSFISHKNGKELKETIGRELSDMSGLRHCGSYAVLSQWAMSALDRLQQYMETESMRHRAREINDIKEYVQSHIMNPDLSLQMVADHIHVHPVTVSKLFKAETGENLSDYIMRLRMEKASYMLKAGNDKIYEIAFKLGYQNPNYFIKVFKKYFGLTPQEYRMQN